MRIAVVGSRSFDDYERMEKVLDKYCPFTLISGGAMGADTLAERYARVNQLIRAIFPAEWNRYGKKAALIRNRKIVDKADLIIAFWDGRSPGTKMVIDLAMKTKTEIIVNKF